MTYNMGAPTFTAVKICGITKVDQAVEISRLGADAIGVIGVKASPRFVANALRRHLFSQLTNVSPSLERVWVIADLNDQELENELKGEGLPTAIQLHGQESPQRCSLLRKKHPNIKWWKALRIKNPEDLHLANAFGDSVDALLLDAWSPNQLGGTGNKIPLELIEKATFEVPWWLAGGISAEWIPEVLKKVSPYGIDASSKLEIAPGIKNIESVKLLIDVIKGKSSNLEVEN